MLFCLSSYVTKISTRNFPSTLFLRVGVDVDLYQGPVRANPLLGPVFAGLRDGVVKWSCVS